VVLKKTRPITLDGPVFFRSKADVCCRLRRIDPVTEMPLTLSYFYEFCILPSRNPRPEVIAMSFMAGGKSMGSVSPLI